jgi:hypothetical protein
MFTLEYAIREVPENQMCLKLNGHTSFWSMPMILIYWGGIVSAARKNTEAVVDASVEVGLEVNADKN